MATLAAWEYPAIMLATLGVVGIIGKGVHWVYVWATRIEASLDYVRGELSFNGGASTRDAVKRIEVRLETIEHNQADVAAELEMYRHRHQEDQ